MVQANSSHSQYLRHTCYNEPRSKLLPRDRPVAYLLALVWNGRGGGKSEGNVCGPTLGGGSGIFFLDAGRLLPEKPLTTAGVETILLVGLEGGSKFPAETVRILVGDAESEDGEGGEGTDAGSVSDCARILEGIAGTTPFNGGLRVGGSGTIREGDPIDEGLAAGGGGGALPGADGGGGGLRVDVLRLGIVGGVRDRTAEGDSAREF